MLRLYVAASPQQSWGHIAMALAQLPQQCQQEPQNYIFLALMLDLGHEPILNQSLARAIWSFNGSYLGYLSQLPQKHIDKSWEKADTPKKKIRGWKWGEWLLGTPNKMSGTLISSHSQAPLRVLAIITVVIL